LLARELIPGYAARSVGGFVPRQDGWILLCAGL